MNATVAAPTSAQAAPPRWPLAEAQSGLWFAQRMAPDNPAFNTAHALWIEGELDVAAFVRAANRAAQEAGAFALRFEDTAADGPRQWVDPAHVPSLAVELLCSGPDPRAAAQAAMQRDRLTPVDPRRDRVAQQRLYVLGADRHVWYLRVHHLATDGYGMALFSERVCGLYAQDTGAGSGSDRLPGLEMMLEESAAYLDSERRQSDAGYWQQQMASAPAAVGLGPGMAAAAADALRHVQPLPAALRARLLEGAVRCGVAWPDLVTAVSAEYCRRMAGVEEAVLGVPWMGRLGSASARVPAMVMNVLPLRLAASEETVEPFVRAVSRQLAAARRHGRYRGEQLRRDLGLVGAQRRLHGPLINVQPFYRPPALAGLSATLEVLCTGPVDDVSLGFRGDAVHTLELEIEANPALYSPSQLSAHATRLLHFVSAALDALEVGGRVAALPLATPAEAQRYLHEVNATAHPVAQSSLVQMIEAWMLRTPAAIAVVEGERHLSYAALDQRSRALALQLRALGAGRETPVVVALPRSLELMVALVAVLRAGAAYLPVDLAHPDARLAQILASAQPVCVLAEASDRPRFPGLRVLPPAQWQDTPAEAALPVVQGRDAAYVIYTSGSTGTPKGVLIEHGAIVNRLAWMRAHYAIAADERILQKTPATFDVSVWEFFLPLVSGARVVMAPPHAHRDPAALAALITRHAITTLHFVPSMLSAFLATPAAQGLQLRRVFTSGEALDAPLRDRFHATVQAQLHNLYGPTEAAVDVSWWPASRDDRSHPVPIGFPVWNTRLYVLDAQRQPLPPGVAGELYLGGVQLARGYLGRDDLTAERFLPDPFVTGARVYRTGDLGRWREDGAVEYLGRNDHQVKLRGLRIELGEIVAALQAVPGVERAEVLLREDRPGERRLVGYVPATAPPADALRNALAQCLPDYMLPAAFVHLPQWPVTANGKLDRAQLPAPVAPAPAGPAPRTATEQALAALFVQTLGLEHMPDRHSDFFALGGDSLSAVQLLLAIQQQWACDPGLGAIFAAPTVAALAARIDAPLVPTDHGLGGVLRLASGSDRLAPLFVIHPAGGIAWNYRELAAALRPLRDVHGLQSPALDPAQPLPASIEALAAGYVQRIVGLQPQGPVHLLGWSVGGIIAQAMAVHLQSLGREVGLLALLDAYPSECWRAEPEPDPVAALRALLAIAGHDPQAHPQLDSRERIIGFLRRGDSALGNLPASVLDGVVRAVTGTNLLIRAHRHARFEGTLLHVRAARDHATRPHLRAALWAPHAAQIESLDMPFLHAELTGRDAVAQLAPLLSARLQQGDNHNGASV